MGYSPGQICKDPGVYKCTNDNNKIKLSKDEAFPTCNTCLRRGLPGSWVLEQKAQ